MRARYVKELVEGARVDAPFALRSKELRVAKTGDAYLAMELADRTGAMRAVLFRPSSGACAVPAGSVVRAVGTVTSFRGARRLSLTELSPAERWEPAELLPSSRESAERLIDRLRGSVRSVNDAGLRKVLNAVFGDQSLLDRFASCPGSQDYHHAHLGGLLEHSLAVADLCLHVADQHVTIDRDLLLTAALLHDIGKIDELTFEASIGYSDAGRLVGHVVLGAQRVRDAALRVKLDGAARLRLEHAILSHHGELEWGAPKRPATIEALVLHHVDNLDAKAAGFSALLSGATAAEENWTDASNLFRRPLHAPRAAEDDRIVDAPEDLQPFLASA